MNAIGNNKKINLILCYVGLFFLVILLIMPPVFRLVFKEKKEEVKKNVVVTMRCNKENEEVNSTFLNDEPQVIQYSIIGDYSIKNESETNEKTESTLPPSEIITKFAEFGNIVYHEENNTSVLKVVVSQARGSADYELLLRNQPTQEEYFKSQGFSCIKQTLEQ